MSRPTFRVAWTADFRHADGSARFADVGLDVLAGQPHIEVTSFADHRAAITSDQLAGLNGVIVLEPRVTEASLAGAGELLAVTRFGVGYASVDVPACTRADVLAIITAGAVDRSMAEATLAWMLALTHHVRVKDALVREARWDERSRHMGTE